MKETEMKSEKNVGKLQIIQELQVNPEWPNIGVIKDPEEGRI